MTKQEAWEFIAQQWEKSPSEEILFTGSKVTHSFFTFTGLCNSVLILARNYKISNVISETMIEEIDNYMRQAQCNVFLYPAGENRAERAALAREFSKQSS